ncbi:MAG: rhombosortase [Pseudomonadota bacterium]
MGFSKSAVMLSWLPRWAVWHDRHLHAVAVFVVIGIVIALVAQLDDTGRGALGMTRSAVQEGEFWRLLTGHVAHLTAAHAYMNILGLVFMTVLLWDALDPVGLIAACLASALAISFGILVFLPDLTTYVGWSGITHGVVAWGGLRLWQVGRRPFATIVLVGLSIKLGWESLMGATPGATEAIGGLILLESHLYGAIGGALVGLWPVLRRPRAIGLALLVCIAASGSPGPAQAHTDAVGTARITIDGADTLILTLDIETAAFVLRAPAGHTPEDLVARVQGMRDGELSDYINGAGTFLLQRVAFVDQDGTRSAPLRIRMPTPDLLRGYVDDAAAGAEHALPILLAFDRADVAKMASPALHLPELLGAITLRIAIPGSTQALYFLPPGLPSEPLLALTRAGGVSGWRSFGAYVAEGAMHGVARGWHHALIAVLIALATPVLLSSLRDTCVFAVALLIPLPFAIPGPNAAWIAWAISLTVALFGGDTLRRIMKAPGAKPITAAVSGRLAILAAIGLIHGIGLTNAFQLLSGATPPSLVTFVSFGMGTALSLVAVTLAALGLIHVLSRVGGEQAAWTVRAGLSGGVAVVGVLWLVERSVLLLT